jgi:hypothetical protein
VAVDEVVDEGVTEMRSVEVAMIVVLDASIKSCEEDGIFSWRSTVSIGWTYSRRSAVLVESGDTGSMGGVVAGEIAGSMI